MKTNGLTKKALEHIHEECFRCTLRAYEGGACGGGWDGDGDLFLSRAQILYLLFNEADVNGEITEAVDVYDLIADMAHEGSWPDGDPDDEDISYCSYSGESYILETYLESWNTVLKKIEKGEITEANLEEWLKYFDDSSNWDDDIEFWFAWKKN